MTLWYYLLALYLTLCIESLVVVFLGYKTTRFLKIVLLANLITHPLLGLFLYFYLKNYGQFPSEMLILFLEILIVLTESLILYFFVKEKYLTMLMVSLLMNAASYLFGVFFFN